MFCLSPPKKKSKVDNWFYANYFIAIIIGLMRSVLFDTFHFIKFAPLKLD